MLNYQLASNYVGAGGDSSLGGRPQSAPSSGALRGVPVAHLTPKHLRAKKGTWAIEWCRLPLRLQPRPGPVVALASFPGSGNTWLRYLIQQATGDYPSLFRSALNQHTIAKVCLFFQGLMTGSVYKDYSLMKYGFPGESIANGSVIAVKTHEFGRDAIAPFDRAVLLIRDPFASIQAEFNRRSGGHVGYASAEKYRRENKWRNFVLNKAEEWAAMNLAWYSAFANSTGSGRSNGGKRKKLLLLRYDDLREDPERELRRVLDFLGVSAEVSRETMECVMSRREGIYKRPRRPLGFDVFGGEGSEMRRLLEAKMSLVYGTVGLKAPLPPPPPPPPPPPTPGPTSLTQQTFESSSVR